MDLISYCALHVAKVVWQPARGGYAFTVVCKATFELRPDVSPLASKQEPVATADVSANEGASLSLASDLAPFKTRAEVLVTGHAYAPEGRPVPSLVARLAVGDIDKAVMVLGDRSFGKDGRLGDPSPFTRMPLVWERAAGGPGTSNPVGRPSGAAARPELSGDLSAPNLRPAGLLLSDVVPPVGFGPIAPLWPSRAAFLHRHAAQWDPNRWAERPLPADIDFAYFNAAPQDQQRPLPFGEDVIRLENLHPRFSRLSTRLAPVEVTATIDHGAGAQPLSLRCDTMIIDTDRGLAMLVWRAHVLLDRPDRPGRVAVMGPTAPEVVLGEWARNLTDSKATAFPSRAPSSAPLPFAEAARTPPSVATPPTVATPPSVGEWARNLSDPKATALPSRPPSTAPLPFVEAAGLPPSVGEWARKLNDPKATALPSHPPSSAPLPFVEAAGLPPSVGEWARKLSDPKATAPPSTAPSSSPLPFAEAPGTPPSAAERASNLSDPKATTPPSSAPSPAPLPFSDDAGLPPHALAWARSLTDAKATAVLGDWARNLSDPKATAPPSRAPAPAPLPFSEPAAPAPPPITASLGGMNTGVLPPPELPVPAPATVLLQPEPPMPVPASVLLQPDAPIPVQETLLRRPEPPAPIQESGIPAFAAGPQATSSSAGSAAASPDATSEQARVRLIQQAIWKGDRSTQEILAEHGLTELSWRAMKRASAKKPGA